ncbi:MAG: CapA family protein [Candidatus Lernaella stagnicola]|nr:CapA family protein [Candidatus Lernaella stagnicola]
MKLYKRHLIIGAWLLAFLLAMGSAGCERTARSKTLSVDEPTVMTVTLVGDLGLGLAVESYPWIKKNGYDAAFEHVRPHMKGADYFVANLETPIVDPEMETVFGERRPRHDRAVAAVLKKEGVGIVGLANNHLMDYGEAGLKTTIRYLDEAGIRHFGAGVNLEEARRPLILEKDGFKTAIVAGCRPRKWRLLATAKLPGVAPVTEPRWGRDIREAKKQADFVIAYPHWGACYHPKVKDSQRQFAAIAVNAGADIVVGHHPHIPQKVEMQKGVPVLYSIGNFVYHGVRKKGRDRTLKYDYSWIAKIEITRKGLKSVTIIPFFNNNMRVDFTPRPAKVEKARWLYNRLLPPDSWQFEDSVAVLRLMKKD